ncbi:MAG: glycoside hydrolase family 3 C-terminal domain-containing protein [Chloroflexota bacterium]|nr:glycoside hydrolase family 3 C-terminal domain-containing protein [Chloroflexota bacterium]
MTKSLVYKDPARSIDERVDDLLARMTLEEKAGLMFQTMVMISPDGSFDAESRNPFFGMSIRDLLDKGLAHFNLVGSAPPAETAEWLNQLQGLAAQARLGIPITMSSDPRHSLNEQMGAMMSTPGFSQWPETTGLAAIGDPELVREFADIARQEYLAVGLRAALHPMVDLATEPRWGRINGTFGEDAALTARLTAAYIRGFQGDKLGPQSVACTTKHFPGGGAQKDGSDPHFPYGAEQAYPGGNFDYHLPPFAAAIEAGAAMMMPYYAKPMGTEYEEVGFAFNKGIISDLLRGQMGFDGVICTDWGVLTDDNIMGMPFPARAWGVEHLTVPERIVKALEAGVDQFGGESCPELIVELVREEKVSEARIDESARRLLRDKFRLGLFERCMVDASAAADAAGSPAFRAAGESAQRRSMVLLKNDGCLPLTGRPRLYIENVDAALAAEYGEVVDRPEDADFAILRLATPFQPRGDFFLEQMFHQGDLDFKEPELGRLLDIMARVPSIVDIYLERAAVIPEIAEAAAGLVANFAVSDAAALDVIFGRARPEGRLPFELPSSMEAVRAQRSDMPRDSQDPLFPYGFGLRY